MYKLLLIIPILGISLLSFGQQISGGIGAQAFEIKRGTSSLKDSGVLFTAGFRAEISGRFQWQTEVGYADLKDRILGSSLGVGIVTSPQSGSSSPTVFQQPNSSNSNVLQEHFISVRSSVVMRFFQSRNIVGDLLVGPGIYKRGAYFYGLTYAELSLSVYLSKRILLGIPISYNYVFGHTGSMTSIGLSMRYYL